MKARRGAFVIVRGQTSLPPLRRNEFTFNSKLIKAEGLSGHSAWSRKSSGPPEAFVPLIWTPSATTPRYQSKRNRLNCTSKPRVRACAITRFFTKSGNPTLLRNRPRTTRNSTSTISTVRKQRNRTQAVRRSRLLGGAAFFRVSALTLDQYSVIRIQRKKGAEGRGMQE